MTATSTSHLMLARWWLTPAVVALLALAAAHAIRFLLVEPTEVAQTCDAAPASSVACVLRSLSVQAFAQQGLGSSALGLGLLACALTATGIARRWHTFVTLAGLAASCLGLVLYNADPSAWGFTLAVMARAWQHRPTG